jgi:ABC-type multidrug transport system fused ATPase/permease subunit
MLVPVEDAGPVLDGLSPLMDILRTVRRAFALVDPHARRRLWVLVLASVVVAGLDMLALLLLVPFLAFLGPGGVPKGVFVEFVQGVLGTATPERVVLILAFAATVLFIIKGLAAVVLLWIQTGVLNRAQVALSGRILTGFTQAPWLAQQSSGTGTLIRTTVGSVSSMTALIGSALGVIAESAVFVAIVAALIIINPLLAISALVYLVIAGLIYLRIVRRPIERRGRQIQAEGERMNSSLIELVGGIKELTIRDSASTYLGRYVWAAQGYLSAVRLITVTNQGMRYLLEILMIAGAALVIGFATFSGSATTVLVSMGVLLAGGLRLVPSLNILLIAVNSIRANEPAVKIVEDELSRLGEYEHAPEAIDSGGGTFIPTGAFAIDDLTFRYPTRVDDALSGISISVGFGEALGIVGSTGSGKSTFVDVLLGLLDPVAGSISIDGRPLQGNVRAWRSQIGFVPQDIFLVDDTLAANITFGEAGEAISDERIAEAIRLAQLEDVVAQLPEGLGTMLGERGVRLSGGQRQRVGLARALYRQPRVLILDEATSALDNETERKISDALKTLHGQLTMVVIAHRLSTVRSCDRILYLDSGRVSGLGTFDELDRTNEGFAKLVELGSLRGAF